MKKRLIPTAIYATQREALLLRIQRLTEAPLLSLASVIIPLLVGQLTTEVKALRQEVAKLSGYADREKG